MTKAVAVAAAAAAAIAVEGEKARATDFLTHTQPIAACLLKRSLLCAPPRVGALIEAAALCGPSALRGLPMLSVQRACERRYTQQRPPLVSAGGCTCSSGASACERAPTLLVAVGADLH